MRSLSDGRPLHTNGKKYIVFEIFSENSPILYSYFKTKIKRIGKEYFIHSFSFLKYFCMLYFKYNSYSYSIWYNSDNLSQRDSVVLHVFQNLQVHMLQQLGLPQILEYSSTTRVVNYWSNFFTTPILDTLNFKLQISISYAPLSFQKLIQLNCDFTWRIKCS